MQVALYSSNYHPAHAQHMHAYALAVQKAGLSVYVWAPAEYFRNHSFLCDFTRTTTDPCKVVIVLNMGLKNIPLTMLWRLQGRRVLFCVHEPIQDINDFRNYDLSKVQLSKLWAMRFLIWVQIKLSTSLVAFSKKTVAELAGVKPVIMHPLLYVDQNTFPVSQKTAQNTIAYIGSISKDHAFDEFVDFVEYCLKGNLFPRCRFVIATKSAFDKDYFKGLGPEKAARVTVQSGRLLSDSEINIFYAHAAVLWCAYKRSNQSGVLPKAYMFGVPVLVRTSTMDQYFQANKLGAEIGSYSVNDIAQAVESIFSNHKELSERCRAFYETTFDYKSNLLVVKKMVISSE